ncbi:aminopeptidase N [Streptomyces vinaceus]|uniref:Aminopeptidase N n=1 Tax=Streptomyces vinaceus TaxID=1960 RepID=A0A5J6JIS2_STRVI|nr:aminopeptidase N [Streptomyces vinaceus]QEV47388.1 aminopeptidase N [Streptomyces vinaceus]GHE41669.1 aminopeptidase N [Streptomyces vinaceus]
MPGTNLTREEAQQRAKLLTVDSYEVELDLSGAQEGGTYPSVTTVRFQSAEAGAETFIDLVAPAVHEVVLNGKSLDVAEVFRDARIALTHLAAGANELRVVADCAYTNTGEGLHRFVDPVDQQAYLYTQFEVPDARRVFASFEQPDLKATFQFTVTAPEGWTVISNSPTPDAADVKDNVWRFAPTPRISTYITALIAGPYHSVHSSYEGANGQSVPLGIYCRPSLAEFLDADAIFDVTRQGFDWFQEKFAYDYPFAKYDQLFVPEFNAGAMENAGAVTIRDQYVFRSKVTDAAYEGRAETILHELAHMWFGDLVTMEWWNDLWLNESFATYTSVACQASAEGTKWPQAWTTFANSMKTWAYRQDQLPSTHPIMADIRDLDDVLVNFDGITYAKGASVLKQLVAYVGTDAFFKGVQAYFKAHAFGNTRLSDLLGALEETSGRDLTAWSKAWLETAGINVLRPRIETAADGTITAFSVSQEAPALPAGAKGEPTLRPHRIAIGLYDLDAAGKLVRTDRIELDIDGELTEVPELVGRARPAVVLLNDDDLSYAKVRLDEVSLENVTAHLGDFTESLPRALCWASAWDMTRDGELATRDYLALVLSGIGKESDIGVVQSLHRQVKLAVDLYADPAWREQGLATWTEAALKHLRGAEPGSDHQLAWARAFAATARTEGQLTFLAALLDGAAEVEGLVVDTELRWAFLERLVATGVLGDAAIDAELERDRTAAGERHAATARAARPTAEAKAQAWASVVESADLPNAVQEAVIGGFVQTDQRELLAPYTEKFFAVVKDIWDNRSHEIAQQIAVGLYPSLQVSRETLEATDAWLASAEPNAALRRLISESRSGVERALKAQSADAASAS